MTEPAGLVLNAVGDIMLGDLPACSGFGVGSMIARHGPEHPFRLVRDALAPGDLTIANLEVVLSRFDPAGDPFASCHLRAQPGAVEGLVWAGIDAVTLANNHIMQHGRAAVLETVSLLRARGIASTGLTDREHGIENLSVVHRRGAAIALLGYNFRPEQYRAAARMDVPGSLDRICADIEDARAAADLIVVSVHWGEEFVVRPSGEQVRAARRMVDAGAHAVLGHHPHIPQGVERYRGRVIAYSLGDFVFDLWPRRLRDSMILRLHCDDPADIGHEIVPLRINDAWQPAPLEGRAAAALVAELEARSRLIDSDLDPLEWERDVNRELGRFRRGVALHYLRSGHRSGLKRLSANLIGIVARRLRR